MLRLILLMLLLANGLFFAWSQGLLKPHGWGPAEQSEPQRLAQQLRPEKMRLLSAEALRKMEAEALQAAQTAPPAQAAVPAPVPTECLQAGLFDDRQTQLLRQALTPALPPGAWSLEAGTEPERWIVYMGRYADADALNKKRNELRGRNIRVESLINAALEPGLSLGGHATEGAARDALAQFASRGVRTARVLQERPETRGQWLKLPQADAALKQRLDTFKTALAGKPLLPCP